MSMTMAFRGSDLLQLHSTRPAPSRIRTRAHGDVTLRVDGDPTSSSPSSRFAASVSLARFRLERVMPVRTRGRSISPNPGNIPTGNDAWRVKASRPSLARTRASSYGRGASHWHGACHRPNPNPSLCVRACIGHSSSESSLIA